MIARSPLLFLLLLAAGAVAAEPVPVGARGRVGCMENPKVVRRLEITRPGVYENYLVDGGGAGGNLVKITADNVTFRNCEVRNGSGNGVGVFGTGVVIENCRIHHMLAGTFEQQKDAHGVTGRWGDVVVRNCDISYTSGDAIQFDPDRKRAGKVVVEQCTLWTGPLPADAGGFKAGQRPGENGIDTKTPGQGKAGEPRCTLVVRNCYLHGWNQPAQIGNAAALNLKESVDAEVAHCVFRDNEIGLRVRGPGRHGGARVTVTDCAVYTTRVGVRAEDKIESLRLRRLAFGEGVKERIRFVGGKPATGYEAEGEHEAPPVEQLLKEGFPER